MYIIYHCVSHPVYLSLVCTTAYFATSGMCPMLRDAVYLMLIFAQTKTDTKTKVVIFITTLKKLITYLTEKNKRHT